MKIEEANKGTRVQYIPGNVNGGCIHGDCEKGVVSSARNNLAFVKYDTDSMRMATGDESVTAQATYLVDLKLFPDWYEQLWP